jgi:hypothetical protein
MTRAERWKARAEECRTLADCFTDPTCAAQLRRLAQSYDQMVQALPLEAFGYPSGRGGYLANLRARQAEAADAGSGRK